MKVRIEFYNESEKNYLLSVLSANFEILDISRIYPNRPPSKACRVYVELVERR